MEVRLFPTRFQGAVSVPVSKSLLHRHLILSALAGESPILPAVESDDVSRTAAALAALQRGEKYIDCGSSGSTMRFLLPVAMAQGKNGVTFTGDPRLLQRPMPAPLPMERTRDGWRITGELLPGAYRLAADETSQLISGLLMALPLLAEPSDIMLTTRPVSTPYIDMTIQMMKRYGVVVEKAEGGGYRIPAPQRYQCDEFSVEGDWSAAAWYVVINALQNGGIHIENATTPSLQGDSRITSYVNLNPDEIDISQTPDLLPPLALWGALQGGKTLRLTQAGFLRGKESDRLAGTAQILRALGGKVLEEPDGLTIYGASHLQGGVKLDGCRDHRMVMLAAFAAAYCDEPVTLTGAEFVEKSYRAFWRDYAALGGKAEVTGE